MIYLISLVTTIAQEPIPLKLTRSQIKSETAPIISLISKIEQIGKSKETKGRPKSAQSLFGNPSNEIRYRFDPERKTYSLTAIGSGQPSISMHGDKSFYKFFRFFEPPATKQSELPETELREYVREAISLVESDSALTSVDFEVSNPGYPTPEFSQTDPHRMYDLFPKTNGIPWGPGEWGRASLLNYTGEIIFLKLGRRFSSIEENLNPLSISEAEDLAAQAVLGRKQVNQTNVAKSMGKMITGNPFLAGQYFKDTPRVRTITNGNLGVEAYRFYFGNGVFTSDGKPNLAYDVVVDAKTGETLRMLSFATLGGSTQSFKAQIIAKTSYKLLQIRTGKKITTAKNVVLAKLATPIGKVQDATVKADGIYTAAMIDSKRNIKLGEFWYSVHSQ
jgi:hypothetical protein